MGFDIKSSTQSLVNWTKQQIAPPPPPPPEPKKTAQTPFEQSTFEASSKKAPVALTVPESPAHATATEGTVPAACVTPATKAQVEEVDKARKELEGAKGKANDLDEQLAKELADFGPALTDEQRAKYVASYREQHKGIYGAVTQKAEALDEALKKNGQALELAALKDGKAADVLYASYKALANSPKAEEAAKFASRVLADPKSPLAGALHRYPKLEEEIAQPAITNAWTQFLGEEANPEAALERLSKIVKPMMEGKNGSDETKEAFEALGQIVTTKKFDALAELAAAGADSPLAKAFAAAGMALGAYEGFNAAQDGKYAEALKAFAQAGKDGMEVLKYGTAALKNAGLIAEYGTKSKAVVGFASKLAPGLGVVASATSLALNLDKVRKDTANFGTGLAIAGDMLSLMGSGMAVLPGGQLPGAFFVGVGGVLGAVGSFVEGRIDDKQFQTSQRRGLEAAGIKDPLLTTLINGEPKRMQELEKELGLNAQQIQQLALRYPNLITDTENEGLPLHNFKELTKDFGMNSQQTYELLLAIGNDTPDPNHTLFAFMNNLREFTNITPEQWKKGFEKKATAPNSTGGEFLHTAFRNALNYINTPTVKAGDY